MINFLRDWVTNIICVIIFISFLEILLPNNTIRKYVRVAAGLLIIVVILTPFVQLFNQDINMKNAVSEYYFDINEMDIQNQNKTLQNQQDEMTMNLYKTKLESQMKNQVEKSVEGVNADVKIDVFSDPKENHYGEVHSVEISVQEEKKHKSEDGESLIDPIKKVEIGEAEKKAIEEDTQHIQKKEEPTISQEQQKEIKKIFLDFYNIPLENISINKQKSNIAEEVQ